MISSCVLTNVYKYKRKLKCLRTFSTKVAKSLNLNLLFFGTDNFSLPSLKILNNNTTNAKQLGVVTSFKSPANCVRQYAEQEKLVLYKWPIATDCCEGYDLGVVVSFGHLIPTQLIKAFPLGMINVHASLLPRWRGAAPIIYAIMNGDKETGVSIMRIEPKRFDIGDIFARKTLPIKPDLYMPELYKELADAGAKLLLKVVEGYPKTFENPMKQNEEDATYAPRITSAITKIEWGRLSAQDVYNRHRALYTYKSLISTFRKKSIELLDVKLPSPDHKSPFAEESPPGSVEYNKGLKCLHVKCANNTYVEIYLVRLEGKKAMSATDFNNGFFKNVLRKTDRIFS